MALALRVCREDVPSRWLKYFEPTSLTERRGAAALLDKESGVLTSGVYSGHRNMPKTKNAYGEFTLQDERGVSYGDTGGASRFFYTAKASQAERQGATHPTVKPVSLMRWLCRLVTPPNGHILDPFAGTGTTRLAALAEGFRVTLIEREPAYLEQLCGRVGQLGLVLGGEQVEQRERLGDGAVLGVMAPGAERQEVA